MSGANTRLKDTCKDLFHCWHPQQTNWLEKLSTVDDFCQLCWLSDIHLLFHSERELSALLAEGYLSPWCCHSFQTQWALKHSTLHADRSPFSGSCRNATSLCPHWYCMIKGNREGTNLRRSFRAHTVYCASPAGSRGGLGAEKSPRFCLQNCSIWLSPLILLVLMHSWACVWEISTIRNGSNKKIMTWHAFKISVDTVRKAACLGNRPYQVMTATVVPLMAQLEANVK